MNVSEKNNSAASVSSRPSARILRSMPLIALLLYTSVMDVPALGGQGGRAITPSRHNDRLISLIINLADRASCSEDFKFAVRAQAQAGLLIWSHDRDRARAIFSRAFQQLLPLTHNPKPASALERAGMQELRIEFLSQVAYCDPEMAEKLARSFALSKKPIINGVVIAASDGVPALIADHNAVDAESRELLVSVALRVAEADSARAMRLGQLSLESGISPYFDRLLTLIAEKSPALAGRLFSSAVDYLERARNISPEEVHALSFYLASSVAASDKDRPTETARIRFLNLATDYVMRNCNATDQSFEVYKIGKCLMELLPRYLPARAAKLQYRLSELDDREPPGSAINISAAQTIDPLAIEQVARDSVDARERDLLYAKAAFGWLAHGDVCEAQLAASSISNAEMRDRALLPIARRLLSKARIKDALEIVPMIQDRAAKAELIASLAKAASSLRKPTCTKTLLNLAELEATKIETPIARARALLAIAANYSAIDPARAFAVLEEAVKALNEIPAGEYLFNPGFVNSLSALAHIDFDRALHLSQQLTDQELTLIAQLAVCKGGLRPVDFKQR